MGENFPELPLNVIESVSMDGVIHREVAGSSANLSEADVALVKPLVPSIVDAEFEIITPQYFYHTVKSIPGYPARKRVLNDPTPCVPAPGMNYVHDKEPFIYEEGIDPETNETAFILTNEGTDNSGYIMHTNFDPYALKDTFTMKDANSNKQHIMQYKPRSGYDIDPSVVGATDNTEVSSKNNTGVSMKPFPRYNPDTICYYEVFSKNMEWYTWHWNLEWMDSRRRWIASAIESSFGKELGGRTRCRPLLFFAVRVGGTSSCSQQERTHS